jgi:hypothetical protein
MSTPHIVTEALPTLAPAEREALQRVMADAQRGRGMWLIEYVRRIVEKLNAKKENTP